MMFSSRIGKYAIPNRHWFLFFDFRPGEIFGCVLLMCDKPVIRIDTGMAIRPFCLLDRCPSCNAALVTSYMWHKSLGLWTRCRGWKCSLGSNKVHVNLRYLKLNHSCDAYRKGLNSSLFRLWVNALGTLAVFPCGQQSVNYELLWLQSRILTWGKTGH